MTDPTQQTGEDRSVPLSVEERDKALASAQRHMVHAHTFCSQCVVHAAAIADARVPLDAERAATRALDEAIENLLGTPRPTLAAGPEGIVEWELAEQRLRTAYRAYRGEVTMCPVPSSITGQPCLLPEGHPQDSATRFHRYAARASTGAGLDELREALAEIAFMGGDCPPAMSPESFYRSQFYGAVSAAARALHPKKAGNPLLEGLWTGDPWGPDGHPLPGVPEAAREQLYLGLVDEGLSDAEARDTVWPARLATARLPAAEGSDPYRDYNEHERQSLAGTHNFDPHCAFCFHGHFVADTRAALTIEAPAAPPEPAPDEEERP